MFLTKEGVAKLGDMNVSKVAKGMCETQTGTPYYASPEVWKDQPYDKKSDIWSLGCVLYETITLKPPFRAEDMEGLHKKVIRGKSFTNLRHLPSSPTLILIRTRHSGEDAAPSGPPPPPLLRYPLFLTSEKIL